MLQAYDLSGNGEGGSGTRSYLDRARELGGDTTDNSKKMVDKWLQDQTEYAMDLVKQYGQAEGASVTPTHDQPPHSKPPVGVGDEWEGVADQSLVFSAVCATESWTRIV